MIHYGREFPMIPPQVNGATRNPSDENPCLVVFPMIPPQVNGATSCGAPCVTFIS